MPRKGIYNISVKLLLALSICQELRSITVFYLEVSRAYYVKSYVNYGILPQSKLTIVCKEIWSNMESHLEVS